MRYFSSSELQVKSWNMHGVFRNINGSIYSKLTEPDFLKEVLSFPIFGLIETHHIADDISKLQVLEYKCLQVCRSKLKKGRKSGGIAVYIHNSVSGGVKKVETSGSESILIKLNKDFFSFDRDIVISFPYCVPANSSFTIRTQFDPFTDFENKICSVKDESDLICLGDFNARTGLKPDYLDNEDNSDIPVMGDICATDSVATYPRGNLDSEVVNQYGDHLLSLCQSIPLRICNGRKLGDVQGMFTCFKSNGQSSVDYCLASPNIWSRISTFQVHNFIPDMSDHCPTSVSIRTNYSYISKQQDNYVYISKPKKLAWNDDISVKFENIIQSAESKNFLFNFNSINCNDRKSLDSATTSLSQFLVQTAKLAAWQSGTVAPEAVCPRRSPARNWKFRKKKKALNPKWYDQSCDILKNKICLTSKALRQFPRNPYLRGKLFQENKEYKKLIKYKQQEYVNLMFRELDQLHGSNPKGYMNLLKSMRDGSFNKNVPHDTGHVSTEDWRKHFQDLLGPNIVHRQEDEILLKYVEEHCEEAKSNLDNEFSRKELFEAISDLKNNKSCSFDQITNEILKTSKLVIAEQLLSLFNCILKLAIFPTNWKDNILKPLHKSGELSYTNNF